MSLAEGKQGHTEEHDAIVITVLWELPADFLTFSCG